MEKGNEWEGKEEKGRKRRRWIWEGMDGKGGGKGRIKEEK